MTAPTLAALEAEARRLRANVRAEFDRLWAASRNGAAVDPGTTGRLLDSLTELIEFTDSRPGIVSSWLRQLRKDIAR